MRNKFILLLSLSALGFSLSSIANPFSRKSNCCCQEEVVEKCVGETSADGTCTPEAHHDHEESEMSMPSQHTNTMHSERHEETMVESKPTYTERREEAVMETKPAYTERKEEAVMETKPVYTERKEETVMETKPVYSEKKEVKNSTNYHRGLW